MPPMIAAINIDCPSCGQRLPTIPIRSSVGRIWHDVDRGQLTVKLDASLNPQWWAEVNAQHEACVLT